MFIQIRLSNYLCIYLFFFFLKSPGPSQNHIISLAKRLLALILGP